MAIPKIQIDMMGDDFIAFMNAYDNDDLPDGAWWQMLEDGALQWWREKDNYLDPTDTVHFYLKANAEKIQRDLRGD